MEIKIGIREIGREIVVETETAAQDIEQDFTEALSKGGVFKLVGANGRKLVFNASQIGYLDMASEQARPVGFGFGQ